MHFVSNDYDKAQSYALDAIKNARKAEIKRTLPAFVYAASKIYEENYDFNKVTQNYFRYSILAEPNNPIIPLLFSIYLDRMTLRFEDEFLNEKHFRLIYNIMKEESLEKLRYVNYTILLSRYFDHSSKKVFCTIYVLSVNANANNSC